MSSLLGLWLGNEQGGTALLFWGVLYAKRLWGPTDTPFFGRFGGSVCQTSLGANRRTFF